MGEENGLVDYIRHLPLGGLGDVVAETVGLSVFVLDVVRAEPVDGVGVTHAQEGAGGDFESRVEGVYCFFCLWVCEGEANDGAHDFFEVDEQVVEGDEVEFGFDVRVLGEVAAGEGFLGAEGGGHAEDVAQAREAGFEVELRGLRQVGFFAVVGEVEEGGPAFDLRLYHAARGFKAGRGDFGFVCFAEGAQEGGADFHYGGGVFAAQDKVPVVVEGLRVAIRGDAGGDGFFVARGLADYLVVVGVEFTVAWSMLFQGDFPHFAPDFHRGFQCEGFGVVGFCEEAREDAL